MLYAILISVFGCVSVARISDVLIARHLLLRSEVTKIGIVSFAAMVMLAKALPHSRLAIWCAVILPLVCVAIALYFLIHHRSAHFRLTLAQTLGVISLKMKTGRSFRQSFTEVIAESDSRMRVKLSEIASRVVFSPQKSDRSVQASVVVHVGDAFIAEVIEELTIIDRQPHAAARRLTVFREKIRMENDFRRRSGQVLARIRAQSLVMSGLYVALAIFVAWKFGWRANIRIFAGSLACFSIGSFWIWRGGKNLKWKV